MGDGEISNGMVGQLTLYLDIIHSALIRASESYHECLRHYKDTLQQTLASKNTYFNQNDLIKVHQNAKSNAREQVSSSVHSLTILHFL